MTQVWTLEGYKPAEMLNENDPNGHEYLRIKRQQAKKEWRRAAWALANSTRKPKITGIATVRMNFGTDRPNQRRDPGNVYPTVKAVCDGLTDAKLWLDDDSKHVITLESTFDGSLAADKYQIIITWEDDMPKPADSKPPSSKRTKVSRTVKLKSANGKARTVTL